ncbi:MAG TPA: hypothetical protein VMB34_33570 [Acetobacteraceae bacterium]|nr:hypothetical protein [Acetobacteraceae bacterium]
MADATVIEYKSGEYTCNPGKPEQFTFWWGDGAEQSEYFNVSIAPDPNFKNLIPLVEVSREIALYEGTPRQTMIILTLQNNNPGPVKFVANHIRVHVVRT